MNKVFYAIPVLLSISTALSAAPASEAAKGPAKVSGGLPQFSIPSFVNTVNDLMSDFSSFQSDFSSFKTDVSTAASDTTTQLKTADTYYTDHINYYTNFFNNCINATDVCTSEDIALAKKGLAMLNTASSTLKSLDPATIDKSLTNMASGVGTLDSNLNTMETSDVSQLHNNLNAVTQDITTAQSYAEQIVSNPQLAAKKTELLAKLKASAPKLVF